MLPYVKERQRYAAIDAAGQDARQWQVIDVGATGGPWRCVTLFDLVEPSSMIRVPAAALADTGRFQLVSDTPVDPITGPTSRAA